MTGQDPTPRNQAADPDDPEASAEAMEMADAGEDRGQDTGEETTDPTSTFERGSEDVGSAPPKQHRIRYNPS